VKDTSDRLIYVLVASLIGLGLISFFVSPAYEKGVWVIIGAVSNGLSGLFGFKFGVHIPKPIDGSTSITTVTTPQEPPPNGV